MGLLTVSLVFTLQEWSRLQVRDWLAEGEFEKWELYYRPRRKGRDANDVSGLRDSHPLSIGPAKAQERGRCQEPQSAWIQKGNSVAMLCCRYYWAIERQRKQKGAFVFMVYLADTNISVCAFPYFQRSLFLQNCSPCAAAKHNFCEMSSLFNAPWYRNSLSFTWLKLTPSPLFWFGFKHIATFSLALCTFSPESLVVHYTCTTYAWISVKPHIRHSLISWCGVSLYYGHRDPHSPTE